MAEQPIARVRAVRRLLAAALILFVACGPDPLLTPTPTPPSGLAVSSVSPTSGISGAQVTISGSGFSGGATVTFGGVKADVLISSGTSITVKVPDREPGVLDIVVTNASGESVTLRDAFTLIAFSVTATQPEKGYPNYLWFMMGTGLIPGTIVSFDGVPSTVAFETQIGMGGIMPAHAPGLVDITVKSPYGKVITIPNAVTYVLPPVVTVSPDTVAAGGTVMVSWSAEVISSIDYIHPYRINGTPLDVMSIYVNAKSGSVAFTAPSAGQYVFHFEPFEGQWGALAAVSNVLTVTPASPVQAFDIARMFKTGGVEVRRWSRTKEPTGDRRPRRR